MPLYLGLKLGNRAFRYLTGRRKPESVFVALKHGFVLIHQTTPFSRCLDGYLCQYSVAKHPKSILACSTVKEVCSKPG
jgi:hypothetical protein